MLSVLGSLIFSAVITFALFLGAYSEKDKSDMVNKLVNQHTMNIEAADSIQSDSVAVDPLKK